MTGSPARWPVRRATPDDASDIASINILAWQTAYRGLLPDSYLDGLSAPERIPRWADRIRDLPASQRAWVVADGISGDTVGYCISGAYRSARSESGPPVGRAGEIYAIYVHPDAWGTGAGWAAFSTGVAELRNQGFARAVLWMLEGNERGTRFYSRCGWTLDGGRKREPVNDAGTVVAPEVRWRYDWR